MGFLVRLETLVSRTELSVPGVSGMVSPLNCLGDRYGTTAILSILQNTAGIPTRFKSTV